jgi:3-phytase
MITTLGLSILISACASAPVEMQASARRAELFPLMNPPLLRAESEVTLGGFSALAYDGVDAEGSLVFWATTDRGPNAASYEEKEKKDQEFRPFLIPDFQPTWVKFKLNKAKREIEVLSQTHLTTANGRPLTGLPNVEDSKKRPGDEIPVNTKGEVIAMDLMGLDTEGFCFDQKNFVWMVEEYRPSILKFDRDGKLLRRYVPMGSFGVREIKKIDADYGRDLVQQSLPKDLRDRKRNRGFEGVACLNNKVYAMMQSPLKGEGKKVRLIEFDPEKEEVSRELVYKLEDKDDADKIGDLTTDGRALYAIEQNGETGKGSIHKVYKVTLPDEKSKDPEVQKELFVDLVKMGFSAFEKVEGLAFVSPNILAVVSDNDFNLAGSLDLKTGLVPMNKSNRTTLGLIPVAAPPAP